MQLEGTVVAPRVAGSVRGLGVCDVLRVELEPVQRPVLDAQIAELERRRLASSAPDTVEVLRLLALMREALPARDDPSPVLSGPAGLVLELVDACVTDAVRRVSQRLETAPRRGLVAAELEAAGAWIATALDCAAVEDFSFEPGADPARAW
jgi:hypothetical protein